jgi:uncharacterized membrane protein
MSIPIGWLGVAYLFIKKTPNQINDLYGYRTKRSKKSDETWQFAHRYYGKIWLFLSPVLMVLITTVFLLIINESDYVIFISSIIITFILITVTSLSIIPVEKALKSHFDSSGVRIK